MADMTCCPLSGFDGEGLEFASTETPGARKPHECCECHETIPVGARYERTSGRWDGRMLAYKTCLSCVEIRNHFACNGWIYGQVWEDLEAGLFPDMRAGGPCLEGLSPEAKQRLFDRRTAWLFSAAHPAAVERAKGTP